MDNLRAALDYVEKDPEAQLFPATWFNGHKPKVAWSKFTSGDKSILEQWAGQYPGCYFCIACHKSNTTVIDVDNKNDKNGSGALAALETQYGALPETTVSQTPSGGYHYIYKGITKVSYSGIGHGIDTPVMVPVPGTTIPGKGTYSLYRTEAEVPRVPQWIQQLAGVIKPKDPLSTLPLVEWDLDHNVQLAVQKLQKADPVVEGETADAKTYMLACDLRDLGVSNVTAINLMLEHWYPRCIPNNKPEFIERKVENAYRYAHDRAGNKTPDAMFASNDGTEFLRPGCALIEDVQAPRYIVDGIIEEETDNAWVGPSNTFKSFLAIDLAWAVASGQPFAERKTTQGPVIYLASEGIGGIKRRARACAIQRGLLGRQDIQIYFSTQSVPLNEDAGLQFIMNEIHRVQIMTGRIALVIIDTLASSFGDGDENSTKDMNSFVNRLKTLRNQFQCSTITIHHTGLSSKDRPRGSTALTANLDGVWMIDREPDQEYTRIKAPLKMKDGVPHGDLWFETQSVIVKPAENGEPDLTSLAVKYTPTFRPVTVDNRSWGENQNQIREYLRDNHDDGTTGVDELEVYDAFQEWYEERKGKKYRNDLYKRMITTMLEKERISIVGEQMYLGTVDAAEVARRQTAPRVDVFKDVEIQYDVLG